MTFSIDKAKTASLHRVLQLVLELSLIVMFFPKGQSTHNFIFYIKCAFHLEKQGDEDIKHRTQRDLNTKFYNIIKMAEMNEMNQSGHNARDKDLWQDVTQLFEI